MKLRILFLLMIAGSLRVNAFESTDNYIVNDIQGWKVYVHKQLLNEKKELGAKVLKLMDTKLYEIRRMLPKSALRSLVKVPIWIEENDRVKCACYHPSERWLKNHDFNPQKAGCVEFGGPENFLNWTKHQFNMVLHELAHAYHHKVIGHSNPKLNAAYKRALKSKSYETIMHSTGNKKRAYAMNNVKEYFAELSEAYFGTNDFYPFVKAEIKEHDPEMFKLLGSLWNRETD